MAEIDTNRGGTIEKSLTFLKKPWAWFVAFVTLTGAFFLNINAVLANVRELPEELRKTEDQFSTWYFEDEKWTGYWTSSPEGYVDAADLQLSSKDVAIELVVTNGQIDGMISTKSICERVPFVDFILLRGDVDWFGDSASVIAFDIFEGRQVDLGELRLHREGIVIEAEPVDGEVSLFTESRIAKDPVSRGWPNEFCEGKRARIIDAIRKLSQQSQEGVGTR